MSALQDFVPVCDRCGCVVSVAEMVTVETVGDDGAAWPFDVCPPCAATFTARYFETIEQLELLEHCDICGLEWPEDDVLRVVWTDPAGVEWERQACDTCRQDHGLD